jgi:hypothetical protein
VETRIKKIMKPKKNKAFYLLGILVFLAVALSAQNIEKLYVNMPDGLNPTITKQNRLELVEYYKANHGDTTQNRFGNKVRLLFYDSVQSCLIVKNTAQSTFEMKLFRVASKPVIGIIQTVCSPLCQSNIQFYDTAWAPVPLQFTIPPVSEWLDSKLIQSSDVDAQWIKNALSVNFVTLSFSRTDESILAKNNTLQFLSDADRKTIQPYCIDKILKFQLIGQKWEL